MRRKHKVRKMRPVRADATRGQRARQVAKQRKARRGAGAGVILPVG